MVSTHACKHRYCERPVVAVNSGGPLETVAGDDTGRDEQTGILCEQDDSAFAEVLLVFSLVFICMHVSVCL